MQHAMPSSVALWCGGFDEAFADAIAGLQATRRRINKNPLGSAAGYGTPGLPLDRDQTTEKLGFDEPQADSVLAWYSAAPTIPLCYATGYELIKAAREHQQNKQGFELKTFHDALLEQGSIALPLVIKRAFGEDAWKYAREKVFAQD